MTLPGPRSLERTPRPDRAAGLEHLIERVRALDGVRRSDLCAGDWLVVETRNSTYSILVLGGGSYRVTGGWFDRQGVSPADVTINGCTFGSRAIMPEVIAGRDLYLEFGNNVVTTRICGFRVLKPAENGVVH